MKLSRLALVAALPCFLLATTGAASAGEFGTQAEAKALLDKAVVALKADKAKALEEFTKKENGFGDRDLYVFCGGPDGNFTAHPSLVGKSMRALQDKATPPFAVGEAFYAAANGAEVSYSWPQVKDGPVKKKISIIAKVDDQVCGVGYFP